MPGEYCTLARMACKRARCPEHLARRTRPATRLEGRATGCTRCFHGGCSHALRVAARCSKYKEIHMELEKQLAQTQARGEELFELEEEEGSKVREVLKIIRRMYEELGCARLINTNDSFQCGPNGNPIINETNVMFFLGVVEQRATELILHFINSQANALDDGPKRDLRLGATTPLGFGPATPIGASMVRVQPPKIETEDKSGDELDEDGGEEEDARPLTQEELRVRMRKKLAGAQESQNRRESLAKKRAAMAQARPV